MIFETHVTHLFKDLLLDAHQFELELENLIGNGIKYTGDGGQIRVSLAAQHGRGIPADKISRRQDFPQTRFPADEIPAFGSATAAARRTRGLTL